MALSPAGVRAHAQQFPFEEAQPDETRETGDGEGTVAGVAGGFADVVLGAGVTERSIVAGGFQGRRTVETGLVPAFDVRLNMGLEEAPVRLALSMAYQSSLAADAFQPAPAGPGETTPLRSHRLVGGMSADWLFGRDHHHLGLFLGYGLRALYTVAELGISPFTFHGPLVRLRLKVVLGARIELVAAPELQLIPGISRSLQDTARIETPGTAYGGEIGLRVRLWHAFALGLLFRESRASFAGNLPAGLSDRERYVELTGGFRLL